MVLVNILNISFSSPLNSNYAAGKFRNDRRRKSHFSEMYLCMATKIGFAQVRKISLFFFASDSASLSATVTANFQPVQELEVRKLVRRNLEVRNFRQTWTDADRPGQTW